jgi:hypothetical protein
MGHHPPSSPIIKSRNSFGIFGLIISMIPPGGDLMMLVIGQNLMGFWRLNHARLDPFPAAGYSFFGDQE